MSDYPASFEASSIQSTNLKVCLLTEGGQPCLYLFAVEILLFCGIRFSSMTESTDTTVYCRKEESENCSCITSIPRAPLISFRGVRCSFRSVHRHQGLPQGIPFTDKAGLLARSIVCLFFWGGFRFRRCYTMKLTSRAPGFCRDLLSGLFVAAF